MFKRIDHVEIVTTEPQKTVDFYVGVLGFRVKGRDRVPKSALGVPLGLVYLELGGTVVELLTYEGVSVPQAPQEERLGYRMIALEVDDMDAALAYLKGKGIEAAWGPIKRERYARAEIRDPNGFAIELRQWF